MGDGRWEKNCHTIPPGSIGSILPSPISHLPSHTFIAFHRPCRKITALIIASAQYAPVIATNAPRCPRVVRDDSSHASGISNSQKTHRLIQVGVQVSPAPLNEWVTTMPNA